MGGGGGAADSDELGFSHASSYQYFGGGGAGGGRHASAAVRTPELLRRYPPTDHKVSLRRRTFVPLDRSGNSAGISSGLFF